MVAAGILVNWYERERAAKLEVYIYHCPVRERKLEEETIEIGNFVLEDLVRD